MPIRNWFHNEKIFLFYIYTFFQNNIDVIAGKNIAVVQTENGHLNSYIQDGTFTFKGIPYRKGERFMIHSYALYGPAVCF